MIVIHITSTLEGFNVMESSNSATAVAPRLERCRGGAAECNCKSRTGRKQYGCLLRIRPLRPSGPFGSKMRRFHPRLVGHQEINHYLRRSSRDETSSFYSQMGLK